MSLNIKQSVVVVTSSDPQKTMAMGTAFIVGRKDKTTFLLTCYHVLEALGEIENIQIICSPVILIAESNTFDLAVLAVKSDRLIEKPILELNRTESTIRIGIQVETAGAFLSSSGSGLDTFRVRETKCVLVDEEERVDPNTDNRVNAWIFKIDDDKKEFEDGQSGSPVVAVEGKQVLGILTSKGTKEKTGYVVSIKALQYLGICSLENIPDEFKLKQTLESLSNKLKQIYFTKLEELLIKGEWKKANDQTHLLINYLTDDKGYVTPDDMGVLFPQKDLDEIDRLWSEASGGKFGFKIQAKIYQNLVGTYYSVPGNSDPRWDNFCDSIGWRKNGKTVKYDKLNFFQDNVCNGHLPFPPYTQWDDVWGYLSAIFFRYGEIPLKSAKNINYTRLRSYLSQRKWKEADQETTDIILDLASRNHRNGEWLREEDISDLPSEDLDTINKLWLHYSKQEFGFSVISKHYYDLGGTEQFDQEIWQKFAYSMGWNDNNKWLSYSELKFDFPALNFSAHEVTLPCGIFVIYFDRFWEWNLFVSVISRFTKL